MQIFVKTLTGKTLTLDVDSDQPVFDAKDQVCIKEGIPIEQQRFIFDGLQHLDWHSLAHYKVKKWSTIFLVLRLRGGMYHSSSGFDEGSAFMIAEKVRVFASYLSRSEIITVNWPLFLDEVQNLFMNTSANLQFLDRMCEKTQKIILKFLQKQFTDEEKRQMLINLHDELKCCFVP